MWFEPDNWKLIAAIILTAIGLAAALVFNVAYFVYVLPHMKRRKGGTQVIQAVFGLIYGQVFEYSRLARQDGSGRHRRIAYAIKASLVVVLLAFLGLGILVLVDLHNRP